MIDFCNTSDAVFLQNDLDLVLQQIDMILDTDPGEVLGQYIYGSDCEKFQFDLTASATTISNYVSSVITNNIDPLGFQISINTDIMYGTLNDIIIIHINLFRDGYKYEKIYKIE
jgi:hypothetical protein